MKNFKKAMVLSVLVPSLAMSQVPAAFAKTTAPAPTKVNIITNELKQLGTAAMGKILSLANGSFSFNVGKNGEVKVTLTQEATANKNKTSTAFDVQIGNKVTIQGKVNTK